MKAFRLPKRQAEIWMKALRSGEYSQFSGGLIDEAEDEFGNWHPEPNSACCLGVLGVELGGRAECMVGAGFPEDILEALPVNYPKELLQRGQDHSPQYILAQLNDGYDKCKLEKLKEQLPNIKFLESCEYEDEDKVRYSFEEIADFIELNTEFYEQEESKEVQQGEA